MREPYGLGVGAIVASSIGLGYCAAIALVWFAERESRRGWVHVCFALVNGLTLIFNVALFMQRLPR